MISDKLKLNRKIDEDGKVTLILPKDKSILEEKYAIILAEIVSEILIDDELKFIIKEYNIE